MTRTDDWHRMAQPTDAGRSAVGRRRKGDHMAQSRRRRNWSIALLVAACALVLTILAQQPVASPGPAQPRQAAGDQQSRNEPRNALQAREIARQVQEVAPVDGVQVAVADGTAVIALKPRPGLSESEHRSLERQIADRIPTQVEGIRMALVTTDPNVYVRVQRLQEQLDDAQRVVGPRMSESNPEWREEFQDVVRVVRDLPNHAQGMDPRTQAGASTRPAAWP